MVKQALMFAVDTIIKYTLAGVLDAGEIWCANTHKHMRSLINIVNMSIN